MSFLDEVGKDWEEEAADAVTESQEVEAGKEAASQPVETETQAEQVQPETQEEETSQEQPGKTFDPVAHRKMMEERRKRQEAEAELMELRREKQRLESQQKPSEPMKVPDAYEQPEEFGGFVQNQFAELQFQNRLETSGIRAEVKYGEETVKAAVDWATSLNDPFLGQRMRQAASPVEFVVQEYQQSRTLERVGGKSFEDAAKEYAEQQGWIVSQPGQHVAGSQPKPSSPKPSRSLASVPGAGSQGQVASDAFGEVFSPSGMGLKRS